jgi:uncharacterized protein
MIALALKDGHEVKALVRNPDKMTALRGALELIHGDACINKDVQLAMKGVDAVASALSTDGSTVLSESIPLITQAMKAEGVTRIVTVGTAGILQSREYPGLLRYESPDARRSSTRAAEEHRLVWERLADSNLDWTVVCPTYLPDGARLGRYRIEPHYLPEGGTSISVLDTANFTYLQLSARDFVRCRVGIAY